MSRSLLRTTARQIDADGWAVSEIYSCPNASLGAEKASLWSHIPSGYSGRSAPEAVEVTGHPNFSGARSRIVAHYRTLTNDEYMAKHPPKGIVYVRGSVRGEKIWQDLNGNTIQGVDPDDTSGRTVWKIEAGPDTLTKPQTNFIARCVVTSQMGFISQYADKLGMVNSNFMTKFGQYGASPGELMFAKMVADPRPYNKNHFNVDYHFAWSGKRRTKWNELTVARKFYKRAMVLPVNNAGSDSDTDTRLSAGRVPTSTTRTANLVDAATFFQIDTICRW